MDWDKVKNNKMEINNNMIQKQNVAVANNLFNIQNKKTKYRREQHPEYKCFIVIVFRGSNAK